MGEWGTVRSWRLFLEFVNAAVGEFTPRPQRKLVLAYRNDQAITEIGDRDRLKAGRFFTILSRATLLLR